MVGNKQPTPSGQMLVELALVLPLFLMLVAALLMVGLLFTDALRLTAATRQLSDTRLELANTPAPTSANQLLALVNAQGQAHGGLLGRGDAAQTLTLNPVGSNVTTMAITTKQFNGTMGGLFSLPTLNLTSAQVLDANWLAAAGQADTFTTTPTTELAAFALPALTSYGFEVTSPSALPRLAFPLGCQATGTLSPTTLNAYLGVLSPVFTVWPVPASAPQPSTTLPVYGASAWLAALLALPNTFCTLEAMATHPAMLSCTYLYDDYTYYAPEPTGNILLDREAGFVVTTTTTPTGTVTTTTLPTTTTSTTTTTTTTTATTCQLAVLQGCKATLATLYLQTIMQTLLANEQCNPLAPPTNVQPEGARVY